MVTPEFFQKVYLVPVCASIWSCSPDRVMDFSAFSILSFCRSYHLLQLSGHPQWLNVGKRSRHYVKKLREELEVRGSQTKTGCEVYSVSTSDNGCTLFYGYDSQDIYDGCIMAVPAPDVIKILGMEAMHDEMRILGAFQYIYRIYSCIMTKVSCPQTQPHGVPGIFWIVQVVKHF